MTLLPTARHSKRKRPARALLPTKTRYTSVATYLEYTNAAMRHAKFEQLDDGRWYGSIPGLTGLWAEGATKDGAAKELRSALDGWLYVNSHISKITLPAFDGMSPDRPPQNLE
ncbi:type II toxin-antitoxin system HicB family antitoxin [Candidatus Binatus sp.]|uniref:type II toxin-antitoxin system HicB family antitoxin n=1 Tax=Candidatus Binatus sp. TaxID=2811406 RepID=UPI003C701301